eukprot:GHVU01183338.1.p1 GENE.GHVU01183338.1~~GHVU01183338.1.p1  ORF type:complete len:583 (+),score=31.41 GHVU01183338.1:1283-3031(+)
MINGQFGYDTTNDRIAVKRLADGVMKYMNSSNDLDIAGDSGTGAVDLDSQTLTFAGGTNIDTSVSGQTITAALATNVSISSLGVAGDLITSGITWTPRASADNTFGWRSVCYGNGIFVAVANSGTGNRVMTSPDGQTWIQRAASDDTFGWFSVCYGYGIFVAVAYTGTGNRVMTSPDGQTWTPRASADNTFEWRSVCYGNGIFVAVAYSGTGNRVMTSGKSLKHDNPDNNIFQGPREFTTGLTISDGDVTSISIPDDSATALQILEGANNILTIVTTNGSEAINIGNATTNPEYNLLGGGSLNVNGSVTVGTAIASNFSLVFLGTADNLIDSAGTLTIYGTDDLTLNSGDTLSINGASASMDFDGSGNVEISSDSTTIFCNETVDGALWFGHDALSVFAFDGDANEIIIGNTTDYSDLTFYGDLNVRNNGGNVAVMIATSHATGTAELTVYSGNSTSTIDIMSASADSHLTFSDGTTSWSIGYDYSETSFEICKSASVDNSNVALKIDSSLNATLGGNLVMAAAKSIDCLTNAAYLKPRNVAQAAIPTPDSGELLLWRDTDDDSIHLVYNDATAGVKSVAMS